MRMNFEGDTVVLRAEDQKEIIELTKLFLRVESNKQKEKIPAAPLITEYPTKRQYTPRKKHKKHLFAKECPICKKLVKGNAAMAMHMKMHKTDLERRGLSGTVAHQIASGKNPLHG